MTEEANNRSFEREQVIEIINSVIAKVEGTGGARLSIFKQLKDLQSIIEEARSDIGAARASEISGKHIPTATDELDAIVEATAEATGKIMDSCDIIVEKASEAGDAGAVITDEVMKVYEACSFQDITGQRITKVVSTLKTIEEKVQAIMGALGETLPVVEQAEGEEEEDMRVGDERLLNGPQMADAAISQDEIDKLLADFD
jgi:chemotaxis protein CheZ